MAAAAVAACPALGAVASRARRNASSSSSTNAVLDRATPSTTATTSTTRRAAHVGIPRRRGAGVVVAAAAAGAEGGAEGAVGPMGLSAAETEVLLSSGDENVLTTALSRSIAVEDYALAAKLSTRLKAVQGVSPDEPGADILDWRALGMAEWLCSRAEVLGYRYPTAVQRRASLAFNKKKNVVIQAQTGSGKTLAYLMPALDNMDYVGRRMLQILIIVPTRELTIQTVMLTYKLFGGSLNVGVPGDAGNMFNYFGPQGVKVAGVFEWDHEEREGLADVAEIVVGTPEHLARMKASGKLEVDLATMIIADEADQLFEMFPEAMDELLKPSPYEPVMDDRQIVLCGVNVPQEVVALTAERGQVTSPLVVSVGNPGRVPATIAHRRLVVPRPRKLVALARQIRADLKNAGEDKPPPRTIVFVPSAAAAEAAAIPLRKSLWGQHKLAVLLPAGKEALRTVQDFKNNKATLLLCTPEAERGLDMPGVDYVYSLDAPTTAASYLHRAGRCGRLGATSKGVVTAVVTAEEEGVLDQAMNDLEIAKWENLEEPRSETSSIEAAAKRAGPAQEDDAAEGAATAATTTEEGVEGAGEVGGEEGEGDGGFGTGAEAAAKEERELTAAALNDIFFLMDTTTENVNRLEDIFNGEDATKEWEEEEEEDPEDARQEAKIADIRKIFNTDEDDEAEKKKRAKK